MSILLTGGAGCIGSHTAVALTSAGNLRNSDFSVLQGVEKITGKRSTFCCIDVNNDGKSEHLFFEHDISGGAHLTGYEAVSESVSRSLVYYRSNLDMTFTSLGRTKRDLTDMCRDAWCREKRTVQSENMIEKATVRT